MSFTQFDFHPGIHAGIRSAVYTTATPIQKKTIPAILLEGKDVLGLVQTGTGKIAALITICLIRLKPIFTEPEEPINPDMPVHSPILQTVK